MSEPRVSLDNVSDGWTCTMRLRIVRDREWISDDRSRIVDTLQQLWVNESGEEDWRDVEIVET